MIKWIIYYGDKTTWSSEDGSWQDAPALNVQVVAVTDPYPLDHPRNVGRLVFHASPFYIWGQQSPIPTSADGFGVLDDLLLRGLITEDALISDLSIADLTKWGVKLGRTIRIQDFDDILVRAINDEGMPHKSGTRPGEAALAALPRI